MPWPHFSTRVVKSSTRDEQNWLSVQRGKFSYWPKHSPSRSCRTFPRHHPPHSDPKGCLPGHRMMNVRTQESPSPCECPRDELEQLSLSTGAIYPGLSATVNFQFKRLRRIGLWGDLPKELFCCDSLIPFPDKITKMSNLKNSKQYWKRLKIEGSGSLSTGRNSATSACWYLTKIIHR